MGVQRSLGSQARKDANPSRAIKELLNNPLPLARSACIVIAAIVIILDLISIPAAYHSVVTPCAPCDPNSIQVTTLQARAFVTSGLSMQYVALYLVGLIVFTETIYIGLGVLLLVRRYNDYMAIFTALTLVTFGGAAFTGTMHALSGANPALWELIFGLNVIGQTSFTTFLFVFPTGSFVPRWTIIPTALWALSWGVQMLHNPALDRVAGLFSNGLLFLALVLVMIGVQVYRYRRVSSAVQRQQTKWVVFGLALGLAGFASTIIVGNVILPSSVVNAAVPTLIADTIVYLCFLVIPIAIAIAITRSRLYDIDILINRTLVYGSLTLILATLYFGLIVGAQTLARQVTGQHADQPPIVIVLSTLLIAALVQPLRRRLQRTIDRRFYRSRYDAAKTLGAFSASLRSEVELGALSDHLLSVVEETMHPSHVSLWLTQSSHRTDTSAHNR